MRRTGLFFVCAAVIALLAACGNKGDLVKPGTAPPAKKTTATAPASPSP